MTTEPITANEYKRAIELLKDEVSRGRRRSENLRIDLAAAHADAAECRRLRDDEIRSLELRTGELLRAQDENQGLWQDVAESASECTELTKRLTEWRKAYEGLKSWVDQAAPVIDEVRQLQAAHSARAHQDALEDLERIPLPEGIP